MVDGAGRGWLVAVIGLIVLSPVVTGTIGIAGATEPGTGTATETATTGTGAATGAATVNEAPLADAGLDQTVQIGQTVYLDASGSRDPDGEIASYEWKIVTPNGAHIDPDCVSCVRTQFLAETTGTYEVTVTVTDGDGATSSDTLLVKVDSVSPPTVTLSGDGTVNVSDPARFSTTVSAGTADLQRVEWYQNGTEIDRASLDGTSAKHSITRTFDAEGTRRIRVRVVDEMGLVTTTTKNVTVVNGSEPPGGPDDPDGPDDNETDPDGGCSSGDDCGNNLPVVNAGGPYTVHSGESITLGGSATDPDGSSLELRWSILSRGGGENTLSSRSTLAPTFSAASVTSETTIRVRLTATDANGSSASDTARITIRPASGGGGCSGGGCTNESPIVEAGGPYEVQSDGSITLAGNASDPDGSSLDLSWSLQSAGPASGSRFSTRTSPTPTFTAAAVSSTTTVTVKLTAIDSDGATGSDTARVTIQPADDDPVADAGGPYESSGSDLSLDGSGSRASNGGSLTYDWRIVGSTGGVPVRFESSGVRPKFSVGTISDTVTVTVALTVTESDGDTDTDRTEITLLGDGPSAEAGGPYTVSEVSSTMLDGSGSSAPGGGPLRYEWDVAGWTTGRVAMTGTTTSTPSVQAGIVSSESVVPVRLTVTDERGRTDTDYARVRVVPDNDAPVAEAGGPYTVTAGETVRLDGSGSSDTNGDSLSYQWVVRGGSNASVGSSTGASVTFRAPAVASRTEVTVELGVTDGRGGSDTDTATVTVEPGKSSGNASVGEFEENRESCPNPKVDAHSPCEDIVLVSEGKATLVDGDDDGWYTYESEFSFVGTVRVKRVGYTNGVRDQVEVVPLSKVRKAVSQKMNELPQPVNNMVVEQGNQSEKNTKNPNNGKENEDSDTKENTENNDGSESETEYEHDI